MFFNQTCFGCGCSLALPCHGDSNEHPHHCSLWRDKHLFFTNYRVGRQGTLLCKEIIIGYMYLQHLNYLPLRGENEVNTSVFIAVFLQN